MMVTMAKKEENDPFAIRSFGSRPSFAAYWADTRFVELYPSSDYFTRLLGRNIRREDEDVLHAAESILHHERVHWQIAHSLSWGMMRSILDALGTTLASHFMREQHPKDLQAQIALRTSGHPLISRTSRHDIIIRENWPSTVHSIAEHAWICRLLPFLIESSFLPIAKLRPPEFMIGIAAQYLSKHCQVNDVLESDDDQFKERVSSFKKISDSFDIEVPPVGNITSKAVEECLAVIGQMNYLSSLVTTSQHDNHLQKTFYADLISGVFGSSDVTYSSCFRCAMEAFGCDFEDLDLTMLGLICELALDPPLPFSNEGVALDWSWSDFHPALRFVRLVAAGCNVKRKEEKLHHASGDKLDDFAVSLLEKAKLCRASHDQIINWLDKFDADNTAWPSEELAWNHIEISKLGRRALSQDIGLLIDRSRLRENYDPNSFYDLPYVLIEGASYALNIDSDDEIRSVGEHSLNAFLSRATDHLAFRTGTISLNGLPRNDEDEFSTFHQKLADFFHTSLYLDGAELGL